MAVIDIESGDRVCRSTNAVSAVQGGRTVLHSLQDGRFYELNEVGARIWGLVNEPSTVERVVEIIRAEYRLPEGLSDDPIQRDVLGMISFLAGAGLVTIDPRVPRS